MGQTLKVLPKVREHETEYFSGNDKNEFSLKVYTFCKRRRIKDHT